MMRTFYLIAAIVGALVPWAFFLPFLAETGVAPVAIFQSFFVNGGAAAMSADLIISILVFMVFATITQMAKPVQHGWLPVPLACLVGLSCALPLFLYIREGTDHG